MEEIMLYHFNPNDYDSEYFVEAESKIKAYEYLISYLTDLLKKYPHISGECEKWSQVDPTNSESFPSNYTLDEYETGQVVETENS
jgi:hypothetical protein